MSDDKNLLNKTQPKQPTDPTKSTDSVDSENITSLENQETVEIPKKDWDGILDRINTLENSNLGSLARENVHKKPETDKRRTVKVRTYDGCIVVKYGKMQERKNKEGEFKLMAKLTYEKDGKEVESDWVEMVKFWEEETYLEGKIVSVEEEYIEKNKENQIARKVLSKDQWKMEKTGEMVSAVVRIPDFVFTIELENGETIKLHQDLLN